ncbi:MAG: helix-turn-helix domain-containing protein, partial [Nocardioides sp.]
TVAIVISGPPLLFELGVLHEIFGIDRSDEGVPRFDLRICAERPGESLALGFGITLTPEFGLDAALAADLVIAPAGSIDEDVSEPIRETFRLAHARGAGVLSVCSGAFTLAQAGILDGRRAATHWRYAEQLRSAFPDVDVDDNVLFVEHDGIVTSAGTAAGIDACLHLVRRELGAEVANRIARRMVVPPQREGGQLQYIQHPVPACSADTLTPILQWMTEHLDRDLSVRELATRATMSERTFARRFAAETGTTPARWLLAQRLHRARTLLERSDLSIESVANSSGFRSASLLRHHFSREVGVPPATYRRTFWCDSPG